MVKWIVAAVMVGIVIFLYAALVAGGQAERLELDYWQDKARKEGREHGKTEA
jgi:hypothetical protein